MQKFFFNLLNFAVILIFTYFISSLLGFGDYILKISLLVLFFDLFVENKPSLNKILSYFSILNIFLIFLEVFNEFVISGFNSLFFKKLGLSLFLIGSLVLYFIVLVGSDYFKYKKYNRFLLISLSVFLLIGDIILLKSESFFYLMLLVFIFSFLRLFKVLISKNDEKIPSLKSFVVVMFLFAVTVFTTDLRHLQQDKEKISKITEKQEAVKVHVKPEKEIVRPLLKPDGKFIKNKEIKTVTEKKVKKKNILLITIDALTPFHLDLYGYKRKTAPNLTEFAKKSFVFKKAFSQGPNTRPAVASLLTSKYVTQIYWTDRKKFIPLKKENLTFAEILEKEGYETFGVVTHSYFLKRFGYNQGFKHWDTDLISLDPKIAFEQETARRIYNKFKKIIKSRDKNKPCFVWLHFFDPHDSYVFRKEARNFGKKVVDIYDNEINYTDIYLGKLFKFMENKNILDDFVVIITADHGEAFGSHGYIKHGRSVYNDQMWVPLIIRFPNKEHKTIEHEVAHIDILPTVLDYLNINKYFKILSGKSILEKIKNNDFPPVYTLLFKKGKEQYAVSYKGYKLDYFKRSDLKKLYDLRVDMNEKHDISSEYPEIKYELWNMLSKWIREQNKTYEERNK